MSYDFGDIETVSAAAAMQEAESIVRPTSLGFATVRPGVWCRADPDRIAMLRLALGKGGSYRLVWGVSLPYVPHTVNPKPRYHRTVKSARFDLFDDVVTMNGSTFRAVAEGTASNLHGTSRFHDDLVRVWDLSRSHADDFWRITSQLDGLYETAVRQHNAEETQHRMRHNPSPALIAAFVAARLGRQDDARKWLAAAMVGPEDMSRYSALLVTQDR